MIAGESGCHWLKLINGSYSSGDGQGKWFSSRLGKSQEMVFCAEEGCHFEEKEWVNSSTNKENLLIARIIGVCFQKHAKGTKLRGSAKYK